MRKTRIAFLALALAAGLAFGGVALANPGPGNSNQCAPGQHGGPTKPGPCNPDK
jgi:hypothetical protein